MNIYNPLWRKSKAPAIPVGPQQYTGSFMGRYSNVLRLYFNEVDRAVSQLVDYADTSNYYANDTNAYTVVGSQNAVTVGTDYVPLVSIKIASDSLSSVVIPYWCTGNTDNVSAVYTVAVLKNAALTAASYDTTTLTHVDFDTSATALTGGTTITSKTVVNGAQFELLEVFDPQLRLLTGEVYTLAAKVASGTSTVSGSIQFVDVGAAIAPPPADPGEYYGSDFYASDYYASNYFQVSP